MVWKSVRSKNERTLPAGECGGAIKLDNAGRSKTWMPVSACTSGRINYILIASPGFRK